MALVATATKISLDSTKTPTGFTNPGGANLASSQPTYSNLALSILKSAIMVGYVDTKTAFDKIRTDAIVGIEKQIADRLTDDDIGTVKTATYNIDWKNITNNQTFASGFYTDAVGTYIATVDVYVNIS